MTLRFFVVFEASEDYHHATELADRVLLEVITWLEPDALEFHRQWIGEHEQLTPLTWRSIPHRAKAEGIHITGFIDGESPRPDAKAAMRAIRYLQFRFPQQVDAVVLIRDQDNQPERLEGLEQARQANVPLPIAVGLAVPERECWILNGFESQDENERECLAAERRILGFDPRLRAEELTAGADDNAPKSPKRVCRVLTGNDMERKGACWMRTSLGVLRERGSVNGLASYLSDIKQHLAPLISPPAVHEKV